MARRSRLAVVLTLAPALSGCVTSQDTVKAQWGDMWQARLNTYKEAKAVQNQQVEQTLQKAVAAHPETASAAIEKHFRSVYQRSFNDGKAIGLSGFLEYKSGNVSPTMLLVWTRDQIGKNNAWNADLKAKWERHIQTGQQQPLPDGYFLERFTIIDSFGLSDGLHDELVRTQNELAGYNSDLNIAAADDSARSQRAAAAMMMFGQGMQNTAAQMQQMNFQNQLIQSINRPVTCNRVGTFTSCY